MRTRKVIALFLCVCLAAGLLWNNLPQNARAASSSEIRDQIDQLEKQEQELQAQIDALEQQRIDNQNEIEQIVSQKQNIDQQITLLNQQLLNIQEQIRSLKILIADQQDRYDQAVADYDELNTKYKERIRAMEERGSISYWSILFRANSLSDFLDRLNMVSEIAQADRSHLQQLRAAAQQVQSAQAELQTQQAALQTTQEELEAAQLQLEEKRGEADTLLRQLVDKEEEFEKLLDESELAQQELLTQIAQKEVAFDNAAYAEWLATYVPPTQAPTTPTPDSSGEEGTTGGTDAPASGAEWVVPVPYYTLTSPFGMRLHPVYGVYRMHQGIDMACAEMTPIYASRGGQVTIAKYSDTAGNYVQINHGDGYRSVYMHMIYYTVTAGQYVAAGQVIGYVGNTGVSKGNHLHFGISYNGEYINPYPFISGN